MKKWTSKHTLLTVAGLGLIGYLVYMNNKKTPSASGAASSLTGGTSYFAAEGNLRKKKQGHTSTGGNNGSLCGPMGTPLPSGGNQCLPNGGGTWGGNQCGPIGRN